VLRFCGDCHGIPACVVVCRMIGIATITFRVAVGEEVAGVILTCSDCHGISAGVAVCAAIGILAIAL